MTRAVVLTGGVGGAKLVHGLIDVLPAQDVTAIVNTGDDFRHLGLHVSPDIDTLIYTLSGKANRTLGWGREGESWAFMQVLCELGGPDWFQLGDGDLALHVLRSLALAEGRTLSAVTADLAGRFGIGCTILPMSDASVPTIIDSDEGRLEFQRYFVERQCRPSVRAIHFEGAVDAAPAPGVLEAIAEANMILIAPSNPFLSVDPILAIPAIRKALRERRAPVVAVSPLIGGQAVKGPTVKLMAELGLAVSNQSIARHYDGLIDGLLIDTGDRGDDPGIAVSACATLMKDREDKARVASQAISFAMRLAQ